MSLKKTFVISITTDANTAWTPKDVVDIVREGFMPWVSSPDEVDVNVLPFPDRGPSIPFKTQREESTE